MYNPNPPTNAAPPSLQWAWQPIYPSPGNNVKTTFRKTVVVPIEKIEIAGPPAFLRVTREGQVIKWSLGAYERNIDFEDFNAFVDQLTVLRDQMKEDRHG